jgi:4-hydroxythreonine-4-phosphate dehydrogenase
MLLKRASELSINIHLKEYDRNEIPRSNEPGLITILPIKLANQISPGTPDCSNAQYILETLDHAIDGCLSNEFSAMVTGPINKAIINQAGFKFMGHTEYIAEKCNHVLPVMMLMNQSLRIALVTTHIPLSEVSNRISRDLVEQVILIVHRDLNTKFRISSPRILICGLNPHAGEQGYLGNEEIDFLQPVISKLQQKGLDLVGPVAADTAFTPESLKQKDAVICMYHDQGLPVLKAQGFGEIVNLTLGLPIVRTSVDHGTAMELAGKGMANDNSLIAAINCAISLSTRNDKSL